MKKEMLAKVLNSKKNLIVTGDISSGKTTSVLFPLVEEMINRKESLMLLDSKEEYINKYYKTLKDNGYNVVILNLRDLDKSEGWNPIEYAYSLYKKGHTDKAIDYLEKIAKTIFYEDSSVDPFWSFAASDFFTGVALGLFEDGKEEEINLNSINAMFSGSNEKLASTDYLSNYFKLKNPNSLSYICALTTILSPNETKGSILAVASQKLKTYVSREKLTMLMSKTTFDFEDVVNKPTAIFFIAKDESKYLNTLAAMFIEQLFSILIDMKSSNKFNFILDNFDIIERINEFTNMLGSGLSRKIKFAISTRSLEDLLAKYGSYITKLSNQIYTTKSDIKMIIDGEEVCLENECEETLIEQNEVVYPKLELRQVKTFNLKEFVVKAKKEETTASSSTSLSLEIPREIDVAMKKIDENMNEIKRIIAQMCSKRDEIHTHKAADVIDTDTLIEKIDAKLAEVEAQGKLESDINRLSKR